MKIKNPLFIVGSGRSGTTILYRILALHPDLCWFSNLTNRYPGAPSLAASQRLLDAPVVGNWLKQRLLQLKRPSLRPSEAGNIYHRYCGFDSSRKMTADELTAETERKFKAVVEAHLRATGKPRFMNKQTANVQRIGVIDRMFPDAFFVHILRDGRAVANSLLRVDWWQATDVWWLGGKPETWEQMGGDPLELCALQWRRDVEEILLNKNQFANRYLEIKYEELVQDTRGVVDKAVRFCGLGEDAAFRATIPETLPNMNQKWREQLDESQQLVLENTIGDFLMELGYGP